MFWSWFDSASQGILRQQKQLQTVPRSHELLRNWQMLHSKHNNVNEMINILFYNYILYLNWFHTQDARSRPPPEEPKKNCPHEPADSMQPSITTINHDEEFIFGQS